MKKSLTFEDVTYTVATILGEDAEEAQEAIQLIADPKARMRAFRNQFIAESLNAAADDNDRTFTAEEVARLPRYGVRIPLMTISNEVNGFKTVETPTPGEAEPGETKAP